MFVIFVATPFFGLANAEKKRDTALGQYEVKLQALYQQAAEDQDSSKVLVYFFKRRGMQSHGMKCLMHILQLMVLYAIGYATSCKAIDSDGKKKTKAELTSEQKYLLSFKFSKKIDTLCSTMSGGARSIALTKLQEEEDLVKLKVLTRATTRVMGFHTQFKQILLIQDSLSSYRNKNMLDKVDIEGKSKLSQVLPSRKDVLYHELAEVTGEFHILTLMVYFFILFFCYLNPST